VASSLRRLVELAKLNTMIRIIDEVNRDDPRPPSVEDRHGQAHEQEVGSELKPSTIKGVQPRHDGIIAGCLLHIGAAVPDGSLIDCCKNEDRGIEG